MVDNAEGAEQAESKGVGGEGSRVGGHAAGVVAGKVDNVSYV